MVVNYVSYAISSMIEGTLLKLIYEQIIILQQYNGNYLKIIKI